MTLHAEHGVHLLHKLGEGEFLVLQGELARFDAGHVQNFVDEVQQVFGGASDFLQVVLDLVRKPWFMEGEAVQPDDGVHGGANLVAHVGEEYGLCPVGFFCHLQGFGQGLPLDTVLGFLDFVLERNPCGAPDMQDDKDEHGDEHKGRYRRKELAPDDDSRRDAANLVADDTFPDEVGEHPVCIVDRHVVQGLANVVVGERDFAFDVSVEIVLYLFKGIAHVVIGVAEGVQQVVFAGKAAQHHVGEGFPVFGVDVTEGGVVVAPLQGEPF